jgi:hypothetical protein
MASIINGSSPTVTFSDGTTQATSAIVSGYVPYANLPAGSVLQVVYGQTGTQVLSSTSTMADTGLTASITPKFATSKVLVLVSQNGISKSNADANNTADLRLLRGATAIINFAGCMSQTSATTLNVTAASTCFLDSPSTTSATTYKTQFASRNNTASVGVQFADASVSTITLLEIAA